MMEEVKHEKNSSWKLFVIIFIILGFLVGIGVFLFFYNMHVEVTKVSFSSAAGDKYVDNVIVDFKERFFDVNQDVWCLLSTKSSNKNISINDSGWVKASNQQCILSGVPGEYYLYFKNKDIILSMADHEKVSILELAHFDIKDEKVILVPAESYSIDYEFTESIKSGTEIIWKSSNTDVVTVNDGKLVGVGDGSAVVSGTTGDGVSAEVEVVVTSLATIMPQSFPFDKPFLGCEQYTSEEAELLDQYLENRIARVGYQTRAGVVEAARFLTLSFPYRISYFFENGRMNPHDVWKVDAEGRYYHKGLYLSKDKYDYIAPVMDGPAMWGCNLINRDDSSDDFVLFGRYPNGLDCSGFVSWVLLNGGFDVGDVGAGDSPYYDDDLSDLGEYLPVTYESLASGKIKVGDLIGIWGHAAIIVGFDDTHFYVAESNTQFKGVVLNTYTWSELINSFTFIRMMDSVYKEDGKLTNLWY